MLGSLVMAGADSAFSVTSALQTGTELIKWVLDTISSNPILTACLVVGLLIPAGIGIFSYLKNSVR